MVGVPFKSRKKIPSIEETINGHVYLFGGVDETSSTSSRLYKLTLSENDEVTADKVEVMGGPEARHSHCAQFIEPIFMAVYGGQSSEEVNGSHVRQGIFNDVYLFNIEQGGWIQPTIHKKLDFRFGASSCANKNFMYIFGGRELKGYADGDVLELEFDPVDERKGSRRCNRRI